MPRKRPKPPRRRARQDRSRETVRIVLEAAAQVLRGEGYARATTNRIAEAAGVSVGTIYQYFPDKDVLFDALVREYFADVLRRMEEEPADTSLPLEAALRRIIGAGIGAQRHGPELLRALEQIPNAVFRRRLLEGKHRLVAHVRALLEIHRSSLRPLDLDRAAVLMVNAAEGIGYNATTDTFDERLADELTTLFVRYLTDREGRHGGGGRKLTPASRPRFLPSGR
jgi:AcrR family transcriptional regulator